MDVGESVAHYTHYRRPYRARLRDRVRSQLRLPFDESVWDPDVVTLNLEPEELSEYGDDY